MLVYLGNLLVYSYLVNLFTRTLSTCTLLTCLLDLVNLSTRTSLTCLLVLCLLVPCQLVYSYLVS